jgi:hypothetical protein
MRRFGGDTDGPLRRLSFATIELFVIGGMAASRFDETGLSL